MTKVLVIEDNANLAFGLTRSLESEGYEVEAVEDGLRGFKMAREGNPDLVQISGGEPTIHPQIVEILKLCKTKPIRHVMLNTNGIRIARDNALVAELEKLKPGFEV